MKKNKNLVVLVGESGTGKDTVRGFLKPLGFVEVVGNTERNIRPGEVDGLSYNFNDVGTYETVDKSTILAETIVDGFRYWKTVESFEKTDSDKIVCIVEPTGVLQLLTKLKNKPFNIFVVRLCISEKERFDRLLEDGGPMTEDYKFSPARVQGILDRMARDKNNFTAIDLKKYCEDLYYTTPSQHCVYVEPLGSDSKIMSYHIDSIVTEVSKNES